MKLSSTLLSTALVARACFALDLSDSHLKDYAGLKALAGVHEVINKVDTPPSTKITHWFVNFYDPDSKNSKNEIDEDLCPKDSQICGKTTVQVPNKDPLVSEVISVPTSLKPEYVVEEGTIKATLPSIEWGSSKLEVQLALVCGEENSEENLTVAHFDYHTLLLNLESKNCCKTSNSPPQKNPEDGDDSKSWGFFTWIFILLVLIMATYIIAQAWINTNRVGGSQEFLSELVDSIVETLTKLPEFLREIASKVTGGGNRGGYSAV